MSATAAAGEPHLIWNAFIDLIATTPIDALSDLQRVARLAFLYDAEVQNGGHLQYFVNHGTNLVRDTVAALERLGAKDQAAVLARAATNWTSHPRDSISRVEDYVSAAMTAEFTDHDSSYYSCQPVITQLLERCLEANRDEFVELRDV